MRGLHIFILSGFLLANLTFPLRHPFVRRESRQACAKADKLLGQGKSQEAADAYTEAARLDPHNAKAYLGRARAHLNLHLPERAEEDYELAIRASPDSAEPLTARGDARILAGRYVDALSDLTAAIRLNPSDSDPYNMRGLALLELDQSKAAIADFDRAIELEPIGSYELVMEHRNRGAAKQNLERYEEALADYEQARKGGFDDTAARADCLSHLKRFREAVIALDQVLQPLKPDEKPDEERASLLCRRATARINSHDMEGAAADLTEAAIAAPDKAENFGSIAWGWLLAKRPVEAEAAALRGLAIDGTQEWIRINLADVYLLNGKFDQAKTIYLNAMNKWIGPDKTGLQAIKTDFAELTAAGVESAGIAAMEALLPETASPPPKPVATPSTPHPPEIKFFNANPQ